MMLKPLLTSPLQPLILQPRILSTFDEDFPLSLGSKLYAWYSPSHDSIPVWQDTSGTSPITADGQLIKRWDDLSGNSRHAAYTSGLDACYYATGYGTTRKCATMWGGIGSFNWAVSNFDHATTNRRYYFATQDRGLHLDSFLYNENNGVAPDLYIQPSQVYGVPVVYCNTAANGAGSRSFNNFRHMGYRNVWSWKFGSSISVESSTFTQSLSNTWSTPTNITMSGSWMSGFNVDVYDIIVTDDTLTAQEESDLLAWMRSKINEPTTFNSGINLGIWGDSLTVGFGSSSRAGWPRVVYDSIGYEPRWAQIAASGLTAFQVSSLGTLTPIVSGSYARNVGIIWLGTNDIYNFGRTAVQAQTDTESIVTTALAGGFDEVYVLTMIKRGTATGANETARTDLNTTIASRAATVGYTVIDVAANAAFSNTSDTTYYHSDQVHITDAGQQVVAGLVETALGL